MLQKKLLLLCVTISQTIFAQQPTDFTVQEKWGNGQTKIAYKVVGHDSIIHQYYENGKVYMKNTYIKGTVTNTGTLYVYYESGNFRQEMVFYKINNYEILNDTIIGGVAITKDSIVSNLLLIRSWYETGEILALQHYKKGNITKYIEFYKNGKMKKIRHSTDNGRYTSSTYFYENGYLESEYSIFKDTVTYTEANIPIKTTYASYCKHWHDNGVFESEGNLQIGEKRIGKWFFYNKEGLLLKEEDYK